MCKRSVAFGKLAQRLSQESGVSLDTTETILLAAIGAIAGSRLCVDYHSRRIPASFSIWALHNLDRDRSPLLELATDCLREPLKRDDSISREFYARILSGASERELALWDLEKARNPKLLESLNRFHFPRNSEALEPDALQNTLARSPTRSIYWKNRQPVSTSQVLQNTGMSSLSRICDLMNQHWYGSESSDNPATAISMFFEGDKMETRFLLKESGLYGRHRIPPMLILDLSEEGREMGKRAEFRDVLGNYVNRVCEGLGAGRHLRLKSTELDLLGQPLRELSQALSDSTSSSHLRWMQPLALRLFALRKFVEPTHKDLQLVADTRRILESMIPRHLAIIDEIAPEGISDASPRLSNEEECLLAKIKAKGPSTRRSIQRSYHALTASKLKVLLGRLIQKGLIHEKDTLIHAVSPR